MKPLEIQHKKVKRWTPTGHVEELGLDEVDTLQAIIDRVNEMGEKTNKELDTIYTALERLDDKKDSVPKRFKAKDIDIDQWTENSFVITIQGFKTKAEAQTALEELLNL